MFRGRPLTSSEAAQFPAWEDMVDPADIAWAVEDNLNAIVLAPEKAKPQAGKPAARQSRSRRIAAAMDHAGGEGASDPEAGFRLREQ